MDSVVPVAVLSVVVGALIALAVFGYYFLKRRSEVQSIAQPEALQKLASMPPQSTSKKSHSKPHSHAVDKEVNKRHHPLDINTLKGHADSVTGLCFSSDGRSLATDCWKN